MSRTLTITVTWLVLAGAARAQDARVELDPSQSRVEFTLSDVLHTVHGTFRMKGGAIRFEPAGGRAEGSVVVDTQSGDSGSHARDRRMHRDILESQIYPEMSFIAASVQGNVARRGTSQVQVSGRLNLHGADHELILPMTVEVDGDKVTIATQFDVPYVQWGLKNPSNFILRVSDKVQISVRATGRVTFAQATESANHSP